MQHGLLRIVFITIGQNIRRQQIRGGNAEIWGKVESPEESTLRKLWWYVECELFEVVMSALTIHVSTDEPKSSK